MYICNKLSIALIHENSTLSFCYSNLVWTGYPETGLFDSGMANFNRISYRKLYLVSGQSYYYGRANFYRVWSNPSSNLYQQ